LETAKQNESSEKIMPKVGGKEYPYTPAGMAAAKKAAAKMKPKAKKKKK
jgi:hypothetical protein